jgi:hypothetical protein
MARMMNCTSKKMDLARKGFCMANVVIKVFHDVKTSRYCSLAASNYHMITSQ